MSNFQPLKIVCRGSEIKLQMGENFNYLISRFKGKFATNFKSSSFTYRAYKLKIVGGFQFKIIINVLVILSLSALFEYLCYGSTAIIHILILSARGTSLYVRVWRL